MELQCSVRNPNTGMACTMEAKHKSYHTYFNKFKKIWVEWY